MTPLEKLAEATARDVFKSYPQRANIQQEFDDAKVVILKALEKATDMERKRQAEYDRQKFRTELERNMK